MGTPVETNTATTTKTAQDEEFRDPRASKLCSGQTRPWSCSPRRSSHCPPSTSNSPPRCPSSTSYSPPRCPPAHAPPCRPSQCCPPPTSPPSTPGRCEGCRPGGYSQRRGLLHCVHSHQRGLQQSPLTTAGGEEISVTRDSNNLIQIQ